MLFFTSLYASGIKDSFEDEISTIGYFAQLNEK